jgi:hypothetical protein
MVDEPAEQLLIVTATSERSSKDLGWKEIEIAT